MSFLWKILKNIFAKRGSLACPTDTPGTLPPYNPITNVSPWLNDDEGEALRYAQICERSGRYELAAAFQKEGIRWYKKEIVGNPWPSATDFDKNMLKENLTEFRSKLRQFPFLIETRNNIVAEIEKYPQGIDRKELSKKIIHRGTAKIGVIFNQLEKGGWIKQIRKSNKIMVYPPTSQLKSDLEFLKKEM